MKNLLIIIFSLICLNVFSQSDSTKDTVAILSLPVVREIITDIQIQASGKADLKKEVWFDILDALSKSVQERMIPKKEKIKK